MIVLVDTSGIMYKGLYAHCRLTSKVNGKEFPTGHVYNTIKVCSSLLADKTCSKVICVRDLHPVEKHEINGDYKEGRSKSYNVHKDFTGITSLYQGSKKVTFVQRKDTEADDVMAVLAKHYSKEDNVVIFSGDNDMLPLASNERIKIARTFDRGKIKYLDETYWLTKFGVNLKRLAVFRTLVGDDSDCIKGIERMPRDLARSIANNLDTFDQFPEKYSILKAKYANTPAREKYLLEVRKQYSRLLSNYTNFHNILNVDFPLSEIEEVEPSMTFTEACNYYSLGPKTIGLIKHAF